MWLEVLPRCARSSRMSEVDPGLETSLRSFLNEIKVQPLPRTLAEFGPSGLRPRRRMLNLFAGAAGIAIVATTVTVFAFELTSHHGAGSPIPGGQATATPAPESTLPILPSFPLFDQVPRDAVLIPTTYGSGTETLPTVTLGPNEGIAIEYGCTSIQNMATLAPNQGISGADACISNSRTAGDSITLSGDGVPEVLARWIVANGGGLTTAGGPGGSITVRFNADPSVKWVILAYEFASKATVTPTPAASNSAPSHPSPRSTPPFLGEDPVPPGDTVLIPVTYGTGPMTLPSFTVTSSETVSVELGSLSTSPSVTTLTVNYYDPAFAGDTIAGSCYGPRGGGSGSGSTGFFGEGTVKMEAAPTEKWVIVV